VRAFLILAAALVAYALILKLANLVAAPIAGALLRWRHTSVCFLGILIAGYFLMRLDSLATAFYVAAVLEGF